jgi:signal recognition particle subunit SEC65
MDFITAIENKLGRTIAKNMMPLQAATYADVSDLVEDLGYKPVQEGINTSRRFRYSSLSCISKQFMINR